MEKTQWKLYNRIAVPMLAPHEIVDDTMIENGQIWKSNKKALLARWTTDFDCKNESEWWYIIKDNIFDISQIKAKRRYEINKGKKNFEVKIINPAEYREELYIVTLQAYQSYPKKYRPKLEHDEFVESIAKWQKCDMYAAFYKETNMLCGYAVTIRYENYIDFAMLKAIPEYEKYAINAAIVCEILEKNKEYLSTGIYICDGCRNISHETAFQEYLEKYFGFRKAYCQLHVKYKFYIEYFIKLAYPFRKILKNFDSIKIIHNINGLLKVEEIIRSTK